MNDKPIVLDHVRGITLDPADPPFNNYQAFPANYFGLKVLADSVRELELKYIADDPHAKHVTLHMPSNLPPFLPCAFNWFSVTAVNYLRLVALVALMNARGWKSPAIVDPTNRKEIKTYCGDYVKDAVPALHLWRNKVAAHFAATDPFSDDNLGTLEQSIMTMVMYKYPHYYVGLGKWVTHGQTSELPEWSLTRTYEELQPRFWPEQQLKAIPT